MSPQLSQESDDNNDVAPTGDLADLTASVTQAVAVGSAQGQATLPDTQSSARTGAYKGCGKGVGKGKSGSSGPPLKCRKPTATVSRPPVEDEDSSDDNDDNNEIATQTIRVCSQRGYTTYPAYMFDIPPRKLKTDNLRMKLMIAEIKNSKAQEEFFKRGIKMMGVMKEFFRMYALTNHFPGPIGENQQGEHTYAMAEQSGENTSTNNNENEKEGDDDPQM